MDDSNPYAAPPSASGTSPTTSPGPSSRPGASNPDYTLLSDEPATGASSSPIPHSPNEWNSEKNCRHT